MTIRRYRPSDQGAVIALFREFMWELAPPNLGGEFQTYIERAIDEELGRMVAQKKHKPGRYDEFEDEP